MRPIPPSHADCFPPTRRARVPPAERARARRPAHHGGAHAQRGTITGALLDAETGETLIGATVQAPAAGTGTTTDLDGVYRLRSPRARTP